MEATKSSPQRPVLIHFKNAAAKAKFARGELTPSEARAATVTIAAKRGVDRKTLKQFRNDMRYAEKINSPEWQANAARIRAEKENRNGQG